MRLRASAQPLTAAVFVRGAFEQVVTTFGGVDTDSAYQAGRMFEQDVAMAKAQDARRWRVEDPRDLKDRVGGRSDHHGLPFDVRKVSRRSRLPVQKRRWNSSHAVALSSASGLRRQ